MGCTPTLLAFIANHHLGTTKLIHLPACAQAIAVCNKAPTQHHKHSNHSASMLNDGIQAPNSMPSFRRVASCARKTIVGEKSPTTRRMSNWGRMSSCPITSTGLSVWWETRQHSNLSIYPTNTPTKNRKRRIPADRRTIAMPQSWKKYHIHDYRRIQISCLQRDRPDGIEFRMAIAFSRSYHPGRGGIRTHCQIYFEQSRQLEWR